MTFGDFKTRFKNWQAYRKSYRELANLGARELDDLGIAPRDIERVARGGRP